MFGFKIRNAAAALFLTATLGCAGADFPPLQDALPAGQPDIDLSDYKLSFAEDFNRLDVSGRRCDSKWIAHTPWNGDFGSAIFIDPSRGFPFVTRRGMLRIEAKKDPSHGWLSGLLSSYNTCDEGFAQKYGYFEIRAKLPPGDGFWPAFWLIGVDRSRFASEIDVFEHHGLRPDQFETTIHVHPFAEGVERINRSYTHNTPENALFDGFNTFGVSVEEDVMIFYFNRQEFWRTETTEEFRQPMYVLLNLAMDAGEVTDATPENAFMYVDYVRAYEKVR